MSDATADQNAKLRQEIKQLEHRVTMYRDLASEVTSMLASRLRGEPFEGWLDPKLEEGTPQSNAMLQARLNQSKQVANSRYQEVWRLLEERRLLHKIAREGAISS